MSSTDLGWQVLLSSLRVELTHDSAGVNTYSDDAKEPTRSRSSDQRIRSVDVALCFFRAAEGPFLGLDVQRRLCLTCRHASQLTVDGMGGWMSKARKKTGGV